MGSLKCTIINVAVEGVDNMEEFVTEFAESIVTQNVFLSYVFFFISQSLQILFPPYPGDMVLILEGYLTELANLNIFGVIINAIMATTLSSFLLYRIGEKGEERILHSKTINYLFDIRIIEKLRKLFERHGALVIILSKLIPGIFSITVISAGIFKVRKIKAYIAISVISAIHHSILIILGKLLGENWTVIFHRINVYNKYIIIIGVVILLMYGSLLILKKKLLK